MKRSIEKLGTKYLCADCLCRDELPPATASTISLMRSSAGMIPATEKTFLVNAQGFKKTLDASMKKRGIKSDRFKDHLGF
jgi:hypothetical protein